MPTKEQERVKNYADIIRIAELFNAGTEFDDDDNLIIRYCVLGEGSIISERINDLMSEKYPEYDYRIKILPKEQIMKVNVKG